MPNTLPASYPLFPVPLAYINHNGAHLVHLDEQNSEMIHAENDSNGWSSGAI